MISCLILETPGRWRRIGAGVIVTMSILPAVPLLLRLVASPGLALSSLNGAFLGALYTSALVAGMVACFSLFVGLPAGVLSALYDFPAKRFLLAMMAVPLLLPPFLPAIGWSSMRANLPAPLASVLSRNLGCTITFAGQGIPLVLLCTYAACGALTESQAQAARLAGGRRRLVWHAARFASAPAVITAALAGVLTLSDPGPGQIFGARTAASEVLTSFSALYDFDSAASQCALLTIVVLVVAVPLASLAAPRLAQATLVRQTQRLQARYQRSGSLLSLSILVTLVGLLLFVPLAGLSRTAIGLQSWWRAGSEVARTAVDTFLYAGGASLFAVALGTTLALFAGRERRMRQTVIGLCVAMLAMPPSMAALGLVSVATDAPAWTDPLMRSRLMVAGALGLRLVPFTALLGLRAWGSTSCSWTFAAAVHGVSLVRFTWRIVLPTILSSVVIGAILVGLLATSDVVTVLLLHPPGAQSLPLAILTVMGNAPESLVAALCLVYVGSTAILLVIIWYLSATLSIR